MSQRDLLRFNTAGSVDDGKSTLTGRLLFDTGGLPLDQIDAIARRSEQSSGNGLNLAAFTDGLKLEREQGITVDASYRYFSREQRDFIIADTPGHFEFTRNMFSATTHSDVTLILVDASHGVVEQNRRHAYIAALAGVPQLVVLINKMDLLGYQQAQFERLRAEFAVFLEKIPNINVEFIPIAALHGENVVTPSAAMPWYSGKPLLTFLEEFEPDNLTSSVESARYVVQWIDSISRNNVVGQLYAGGIDVADTLESVRASHCVLAGSGQVERDPLALRLALTNTACLKRGSILTSDPNTLKQSRLLQGEVCWMDERPASLEQTYNLALGKQLVEARILAVESQIDIGTGERVAAASQEVAQNQIVMLSIETLSELSLSAQEPGRGSRGSFILIDKGSRRTVAAGVVSAAD